MEEFSMSIENVAEAVNQALAKQMVVEIAVQELVRLLPDSLKKAFAEHFRQSAKNAMQEHASHLSAGADEQLTLSVAAMLEAAGKAPKR
jgi:hypothetical protein